MLSPRPGGKPPPDAERGPGKGPVHNAESEDDCTSPRQPVEILKVDRFDWERALRDSDDVQGNRLLVLLVLGTYMRADGNNARPAQATIAEKTGLHSGSIGRHLRWARENGWLMQVARGHRRGDGVSLASVHRACVPLESLPRNESDVERDVEILNRAPGDLYRAVEGFSTAHSLRDHHGLQHHGLKTNTALCERCDDSGLFEDGPNVFVCDHPLLKKAGIG